MMKIKFWGVRGSIPCPGADTARYGGNTACIELRFPELNRLIIIDAGSGIRELGNYLVSHDLKKGPINTEIFLTHTHWDHIMGFPFFTPIYIPGTQLRIYGPVTYEDETLETIVSGQMTYRYFPVRREELAAKIKYTALKEEVVDLGDGIRLMTKYLNHPILCLGYKFEYKGKVFCTCYDTEPFQNVFCTDLKDPSYDKDIAEEGELVAQEENQRIEDFIKGSDLLVYDAQYTRTEYEAWRRGWGHTTIEEAIYTGIRNKVKKLALFHHDPMRTDAQFDDFSQHYCKHDDLYDTEIFFAREQMEIEI